MSDISQITKIDDSYISEIIKLDYSDRTNKSNSPNVRE